MRPVYLNKTKTSRSGCKTSGSGQDGSRRLEGLAAVAPCPWFYRELGAEIWDEFGGAVADDHPYADWIRRYADPAPDETMVLDKLLGQLDRWAQGQSEDACGRAMEAVRTSVRYGWMFWEQAWTRQEWPV